MQEQIGRLRLLSMMELPVASYRTANMFLHSSVSLMSMTSMMFFSGSISMCWKWKKDDPGVALVSGSTWLWRRGNKCDSISRRQWWRATCAWMFAPGRRQCSARVEQMHAKSLTKIIWFLQKKIVGQMHAWRNILWLDLHENIFDLILIVTKKTSLCREVFQR